MEEFVGKEDVESEVWSDFVEIEGLNEGEEVCKGEVLDSIEAVLLSSARESGLSCEENLV